MDLLDIFDIEDERLQRNDRIYPVFQERSNPLDVYDDYKFKLRYRFNKNTVTDLIHMVSADLERATNRNNAISPSTQVSISTNLISYIFRFQMYIIIKLL